MSHSQQAGGILVGHALGKVRVVFVYLPACRSMPRLSRSLQRAIASAGRIPVYLAALGHGYAMAGRRAEALAIVEELRRRSSSRYISPFDIATVYVGLNMQEPAFKALEAAYEGRAYGLVFMPLDPRFDPIRSDPPL